MRLAPHLAAPSRPEHGRCRLYPALGPVRQTEPAINRPRLSPPVLTEEAWIEELRLAAQRLRRTERWKELWDVIAAGR